MRRRLGHPKKASGFTMIELMIVVAIMGVLASIVMPKFADMVVRAKEAAIKGQLGAVRSALSIYYSDTEGGTPIGFSYSLNTALVPKYIQAIPSFTLPGVTAQTNPGHRAPSLQPP